MRADEIERTVCVFAPFFYVVAQVGIFLVYLSVVRDLLLGDFLLSPLKKSNSRHLPILHFPVCSEEYSVQSYLS